MKILKMTTLVTTIVLFSLLMQTAQAEYIDLGKETVLLIGTCKIYGKKHPCLAVEHKKMMYIVVYDRRGQMYQIALVPPDFLKIIWVRDLV